MKRGRKSLADLKVVALPGKARLKRPADLGNKQAELFDELVAACHPEHFVQSDVPLLVSYVQATLLSRSADDIAVWERAVKIQALLATRLRLAPQARSDPKTVGRRTTAAPSYYDMERI